MPLLFWMKQVWEYFKWLFALLILNIQNLFEDLIVEYKIYSRERALSKHI